MVYLHFPSQYTEEEEMLQKKYQKLKRKKKAIQQIKTPKQEPPPVQTTIKKATESKPDAKEVAKKLLKSGAISAIKVENKERQGFKRSKAAERKRSLNERPGGIGYQPYASSHPMEEESDQTAPSAARPAVKSLYDSFVSGGNLDEDDPKHFERTTEKTKESHTEKRHGNTIYVRCDNVTDEVLRSCFSSFGSIVNISVEMDKNCGFVTYEKTESADKAIGEMNGATFNGVKLRVSLARRQPLVPQQVDGTPTLWTQDNTPKGSSTDKRELVVYEEDLF
ncbi:negative elongation factor E-like [Ornithodoros turicata]|uniref:negative elongation factor E-like n=1 Tax=Ornithodoros turicata TaxID=34597 RepID=UPI003138BDCF